MSYHYKHVILVGIDGAGNFYRNTSAPMIRRVMVSGEGDGQRFTFYSETHNVPSQSYALWEYEGDTVILGRGVWFRGDLRNL